MVSECGELTNKKLKMSVFELYEVWHHFMLSFSGRGVTWHYFEILIIVALYYDPSF